MKRFLSSIFGTKSPRPQVTTRKRSFVPQIEALEEREMMAAGLNGGILNITGNNAVNNVQVVINDAANEIRVIENGALTFQGQSSQVNTVRAFLLGGNDIFNLDMADGSDFERAKNIEVNLGDGNDFAFFDLFRNGDAEVKANLNIIVNDGLSKGQNSDVAGVTFGKINEGVQLSVQANLRNGGDNFLVRLTEEIDEDALVSIVLSGGAGNDVLRIDASDDVKIDEGAILSVVLDCGDGNDTFDFDYDGELDGTLKLRAFGGKDQDTLRGDIHLDNDSDGVLDVIFLGGAQNDPTVLLNLLNDSDDVTILNQLAQG